MPPRIPDPEPEQDLGNYAIALYDYEMSEEGEISFAEGQKVVRIEFVSEEWWQGTNEEGLVGVFPANYVELQQ